MKCVEAFAVENIRSWADRLPEAVDRPTDRPPFPNVFRFGRRAQPLIRGALRAMDLSVGQDGDTVVLQARVKVQLGWSALPPERVDPPRGFLIAAGAEFFF